MYEELAKRLREHGEFLIVSDRMKAPPNVNVRNVFAEDYYQAADAIEKLSRMEHDFRKYISNQVNKTSGVYACCYCKNREAFDEDYGCGCDHADCDGANEWEYGTPRKENE